MIIKCNIFTSAILFFDNDGIDRFPAQRRLLSNPSPQRHHNPKVNQAEATNNEEEGFEQLGQVVLLADGKVPIDLLGCFVFHHNEILTSL